MTTPEPIDIPGLDAKRAKRYSWIQLGLMAAGMAAGVAESAWFAFSGRSRRLRDGVGSRVQSPVAADAAFLVSTAVASWAINLPRRYVSGHVVERSYGLTKQTPTGWLRDDLKGLALGTGFQVPLTLGAYAVIRRRPDDWWVILASATVPLAVIASQLAPVLILPLFNTFERAEDEELVGRIRGLAERAGVPIADVYRMDMSRQSEKANAFFTGIGATKRIVLGDTLVDRFTPEEVDGVIAHELGHQVHGDIWRMTALMGAVGYGAAYVVSKALPALIDRTGKRTGVSRVGDIAGLPLVGLISAGMGLVLSPALAFYSRQMERRTDRFALELTGNGEAYAGAMARLALQNLADPDPSRLVVGMLYSHPPVAERICSARAFSQPA